MHRCTRNSWSLDSARRKRARNGSLVHEKENGTRAVFYCPVHQSINTTAYMISLLDTLKGGTVVLGLATGFPHDLGDPPGSALSTPRANAEHPPHLPLGPAMWSFEPPK